MWPRRRISTRLLLFLALAWLVSPLAGCTASFQHKTGGGIRSAAAVGNILRVPLTRQTSEYTCGVAVMQSLLYYLDDDDDYSEETLAKELKADPAEGTSYRAMADFAVSKGYRVEVRTGMSLDELRHYIDEGKPVVVLIQAWAESPVDYSRDWEDGHYAVAIGYDRENIYFMDPSTLANYAYLPNREFLDRWHDKDKGERLDHFGLIISRPGSGKSYDPDRVHRIR